jgi:hypothetical protein
MKTKQKKRNTKNFRKTKINKYRKSQNPFNWSEVSNTEKTMIFGHPVNSLESKLKVPFISTIDSLPIGPQQEVKKYIHSQKVIESGCHSNSVMLSSLFPRIKTVHGYVGVRLTDIQLEYWINQLPNNKENFVGINVEDYGLMFIDFKTCSAVA